MHSLQFALKINRDIFVRFFKKYKCENTHQLEKILMQQLKNENIELESEVDEPENLANIPQLRPQTIPANNASNNKMTTLQNHADINCSEVNNQVNKSSHVISQSSIKNNNATNTRKRKTHPVMIIDDKDEDIDIDATQKESMSKSNAMNVENTSSDNGRNSLIISSQRTSNNNAAQTMSKQAQILSIQPIPVSRKRKIGSILNINHMNGNPFLNSNTTSQLNTNHNSNANVTNITNITNTNASLRLPVINQNINNSHNNNNNDGQSCNFNSSQSTVSPPMYNQMGNNNENGNGPATKRQKISTVNSNNMNPLQFRLLLNPSLTSCNTNTKSTNNNNAFGDGDNGNLNTVQSGQSEMNLDQQYTNIKLLSSSVLCEHRA